MTPDPFVRPERPVPHRYSDACPCSTCTATFRRNVRSNAGNPFTYGASQKPFMSWTPIIVGLGWILAAALVVLLGALAGGFISWNPLS